MSCPSRLYAEVNYGGKPFWQGSSTVLANGGCSESIASFRVANVASVFMFKW